MLRLYVALAVRVFQEWQAVFFVGVRAVHYKCSKSE